MPWGALGSHFTYAFEERAVFLVQQCSKTAAATLLRTTWRTLGTLIRRVVGRARAAGGDRLDGLRLIGVDDLSYRRHHEYVTVVVDHERRRIVWASRGKSAATLERFFEELGPERCAQVEAVTIDLSAAYIKAVNEASPSATLIFDRFHVQSLVHDALDETRRDEVREARGKDAKVLKGTRWALQKSPWNLNDVEVQTLAELEHTNRPLFRGHLLKESLAAILDGRQINVARRRLQQWIAEARRSGLRHFKRVARTIEKAPRQHPGVHPPAPHERPDRRAQREGEDHHPASFRLSLRLRADRDALPLLRRSPRHAGLLSTGGLPLNVQESRLFRAGCRGLSGRVGRGVHLASRAFAGGRIGSVWPNSRWFPSGGP